MPGYEFLATQHINGVWPDIYFALQQGRDMRWTKGDGKGAGARIPVRPSTLGEIHARINDRFVIAPIIGRGQAAPMRTPNMTVRLEQTNIPKIKHGMPINEEMLRLLQRIEDNLSGVPSINSEDVQVFLNYEGQQLMNLMLGVDARIEHMAVGMLLGTYTYANDKGIVFTMAWTGPSDLLVTPGTAWGDGTAGISHGAASATPISDIQALITNAQTQYGAEFDTITISRQAFDYILNTTEFKAQAPLFYSVAGLAPTFTAIQANNRAKMREVFMNLVNMNVEFDDRQVMVEQPDLTNWVAPPAAPAANQYIRYQPANKVILTDSRKWGDMNVWDIANLPVIESMRGMVPGLIGEAPQGSSRGPFGYASAISLNGDPPGKALYAVQEAVPEKKDLVSSAVLTVY